MSSNRYIFGLSVQDLKGWLLEKFALASMVFPPPDDFLQHVLGRSDRDMVNEHDIFPSWYKEDGTQIRILEVKNDLLPTLPPIPGMSLVWCYTCGEYEPDWWYFSSPHGTEMPQQQALDPVHDP
jgi:hypothetical protein